MWPNYRPPATAINFSDIIEDQTIYDRTNGRIESTFNASAIDRPVINPDSVSVDDILRNSTIHEIRDLSQSRQRTTSASINESQQLYNKYSAVKEPLAYDESFRPAEEVKNSSERNKFVKNNNVSFTHKQMHEQLNKDENEWDNEYAAIPNAPSMSQSKSSVWNEFGLKPQDNMANMSDFSGLSRYGNSGSTDFSIGRFFSNRCQELDFLPAENLTKNSHQPMSLIPPQSPSGSISQSHMSIGGSTYNDRNESVHNPVASLSAIASHLGMFTCVHSLSQ